MVGHELRTPLTAISWIFQELEKKDLTPAQRAELIDLGTRASAKLGKAIDSMAEVAGSASHIFQFRRVDLFRLVAEVMNEAQPVARQYGVTLHLEAARQTAKIAADPVQLSMAISNLINNGIKYNHKGGAVTIRIRRLLSESMAEITVEDTGVGILPSDQRRLFTKHFRTADAKKLNPGGTGLGLYLVKQVIARHQGTISVESIHGKGSAFRITLPLQA